VSRWQNDVGGGGLCFGTYSGDNAENLQGDNAENTLIQKLEMPVDTKKSGKQQSTHRRNDAYVIERLNSQGDQAARRGCCG
jgi:hypothetical protein